LEKLLHGAPKEVSASAAYHLGLLAQEGDAFVKAITAYQRAIELLPESSVAEAAASNLRLVIQAMMAHYGPEGAVHAAQEWLHLIRQGEIRSAWEKVDRSTRTVLVQAWILANETHPNLRGQERDHLAAQLAQSRPTHRLARAFLATQLDEFQRAYQAFDYETWGAAEKPRRYGIDLELVVFMMTGGGLMMWEPGTTAPAIQLLMRRELGQWYVASFSSELIAPGWPPARRPLPQT
jgi:hypothetical protein